MVIALVSISLFASIVIVAAKLKQNGDKSLELSDSYQWTSMAE